MTNSVIVNALSVTGLQPSLKTLAGDASEGAKLFDTLASGVAINVWKAVPGTYQHGGSPAGETFVVLAGEAEISIAGGPGSKLSVGSVVSLPPNTPSEMKVTSLLQKVAIGL